MSRILCYAFLVTTYPCSKSAVHLSAGNRVVTYETDFLFYAGFNIFLNYIFAGSPPSRLSVRINFSASEWLHPNLNQRWDINDGQTQCRSSNCHGEIFSPWLGIEPVTSGLKVWCSTNLASHAEATKFTCTGRDNLTDRRTDRWCKSDLKV